MKSNDPAPAWLPCYTLAESGEAMGLYSSVQQVGKKHGGWMKYLAIAVIAATGIVMPAAASDIDADSLRLLARTLARVKPGAIAHFYYDEAGTSCPAMTPKCQRKAYVRGGDVVLIGSARGAFVEATYSDGIHTTEGWLPRSALIDMPSPVASATAWLGRWIAYKHDYITVKPGKRPGALAFSGEALWENQFGSVHVGEIGGDDGSEEAALRDGQVLLGNAGDKDACQIKMRLIGPYIAVADNYQCGGVNVTFSGVYRHPLKQQKR